MRLLKYNYFNIKMCCGMIDIVVLNDGSVREPSEWIYQQLKGEGAIHLGPKLATHQRPTKPRTL